MKHIIDWNIYIYIYIYIYISGALFSSFHNEEFYHKINCCNEHDVLTEKYFFI